MTTPSKQLLALEAAVRDFAAGGDKVEVCIRFDINNDVPDGYVEHSAGSEYTTYRKVITAKNGEPTGVIDILNPD